jgi:hypothetical protein
LASTSGDRRPESDGAEFVDIGLDAGVRRYEIIRNESGLGLDVCLDALPPTSTAMRRRS